MDFMCSLHTFSRLDNGMDFDLYSHTFRCHGCPKKYVSCCSNFGAFKSHDLASGTSVYVRVIVDSMGLGEGGGEHYLTYLDLKSNQSISTFINWHGADLLCNLDNER